MPLVTPKLSDALPTQTRQACADAVHEGIVEGLGIDREDRFQVIRALPRDQSITHPTYLGVARRLHRPQGPAPAEGRGPGHVVDETAAAIVLLASQDSSCLVGAELVIDGGMSQV